MAIIASGLAPFCSDFRILMCNQSVTCFAYANHHLHNTHGFRLAAHVTDCFVVKHRCGPFPLACDTWLIVSVSGTPVAFMVIWFWKTPVLECSEINGPLPKKKSGSADARFLSMYRNPYWCDFILWHACHRWLDRCLFFESHRINSGNSSDGATRQKMRFWLIHGGSPFILLSYSSAGFPIAPVFPPSLGSVCTSQ